MWTLPQQKTTVSELLPVNINCKLSFRFFWKLQRENKKKSHSGRDLVFHFDWPIYNDPYVNNKFRSRINRVGTHIVCLHLIMYSMVLTRGFPRLCGYNRSIKQDVVVGLRCLPEAIGRRLNTDWLSQMARQTIEEAKRPRGMTNKGYFQKELSTPSLPSGRWNWP